MNYKKEDKVVIREKEAMERGYGEDWRDKIAGSFDPGMDQYCGMVATIKSVEEGYYYLDVDGEKWNWSGDMLRLHFSFGEEIEVSGDGEEIEVSGDGEEWERRIFVNYIDGGLSPFVCVNLNTVEEFKNGKKFETCDWKHARKIAKHTEEELNECIRKLEEAGRIKEGRVVV